MLRSVTAAASRLVPNAAAGGSAFGQRRIAGQGAWLRNFSNGAGGGEAKRNAIPKGHRSSKRLNDRGPVTWQSVGLLVVVGGGVVYWYSEQEKERQRKMRETTLGIGVGKPDIGGPFDLIDQNGKRCQNTDFLGKWVFIYFGFTYCPDICPNELTRLREIMDMLDASPETKDKVVPLFITIDPERDGPLQLKEYLADWHPKMIGLTGSPEKIAKVCKQWRVYCSKAKLGDGPNDYLVDHSILFYLVDDQGGFVDYFGKALSPQDITDKISKYISGTADKTTHAPNSLGILPVPQFQYPKSIEQGVDKK